MSFLSHNVERTWWLQWKLLYFKQRHFVPDLWLVTAKYNITNYMWAKHWYARRGIQELIEKFLPSFWVVYLRGRLCECFQFGTPTSHYQFTIIQSLSSLKHWVSIISVVILKYLAINKAFSSWNARYFSKWVVETKNRANSRVKIELSSVVRLKIHKYKCLCQINVNTVSDGCLRLIS